MRILMLGWEFPPIVNGGLGIACHGIAQGLQEKAELSVILPKSDPDYQLGKTDLTGVDQVDLKRFIKKTWKQHYSTFTDVLTVPGDVFPYQDEPSDKQISILGTKVESEEIIHYDRENIDIVKLFKEKGLYEGDLTWKVAQYARFATMLAKERDFDIIYAHDWMTFLAGLEIKKEMNKPLAVHVHSLSYDRGGPQDKGWIYDLEKQALKDADLIISVSNYTARVIREEYNIDKKPVYPVFNGIKPIENAKEVKKGFPEKLVLFLGRITEQKGPELFLDIATKILEKDDHVRFVMAGTGNQLKRLIESGAYRNIGHKFHFTGFLTRDKIELLLGMADVYCMPSVSEPFGLSALEATQYGIPAVISKQSGVAEVLTSALQADYWDVDLFAEHILLLLGNEVKSNEIVKAGYEDIEKLTWENASDQILSLFKTVL